MIPQNRLKPSPVNYRVYNLWANLITTYNVPKNNISFWNRQTPYTASVKVILTSSAFHHLPFRWLITHRNSSSRWVGVSNCIQTRICCQIRLVTSQENTRCCRVSVCGQKQQESLEIIPNRINLSLVARRPLHANQSTHWTLYHRTFSPKA